MAKQSETIRAYIRTKYLSPGDPRPASPIRICAGDVHRALGLYNAVPSVCQVLRSQKMQRENNIRLVRFEGPPSGQSTTSVFIYEVADQSSTAHPVPEFERLWGLGRDLYKAYGGGEKYLKNERGNWSH